MRREAERACIWIFFLRCDSDSKPGWIFFHQPADNALLEVNDDDHDQQTQRDELPAEKIGPGHFLDDLEYDSTDDRTPERALAAEQYHQDHEDVESCGWKSDVAWLDEADHVAEDGAGDAEKECGNRPGDALVTAGV